jgi:hypothetical protein
MCVPTPVELDSALDGLAKIACGCAAPRAAPRRAGALGGAGRST